MHKCHRLSVLAAILGLTLTFPLQGCGLKSDPVPRRIQALNSLTDIRLQQETDAVFIRWMVPEQPRAMERFRIMRDETGADGASCPGCPPDEVRIADLIPGEANLIRVEAGVFGYRDGDIRPGRVYRYRVTGCDRSGSCSAPSAPAALTVPSAADSR